MNKKKKNRTIKTAAKGLWVLLGISLAILLAVGLFQLIGSFKSRTKAPEADTEAATSETGMETATSEADTEAATSEMDMENVTSDTDMEVVEEKADTEEKLNSETEENAEAEENAQARAEAEAKIQLSILGDSLSTFEGYIPEGYSVFFPHSGEITDVNQMWWKKILDVSGMALCGNSSSSGSTCAGDSTSVDNPMYGCSDGRIAALLGQYDVVPDKIIVYIGTNDLMTGVPLGENDGTKPVAEGDVAAFSDAYCLTLDKIKASYPEAEVFCCTLTPIGDWGTETPFVTFTNGDGLTSQDYSRVIRQIADAKGCHVIDLENCGITIENMQQYVTDGVHLKPEGMNLIYEVIRKELAI